MNRIRQQAGDAVDHRVLLSASGLISPVIAAVDSLTVLMIDRNAGGLAGKHGFTHPPPRFPARPTHFAGSGPGSVAIMMPPLVARSITRAAMLTSTAELVGGQPLRPAGVDTSIRIRASSLALQATSQHLGQRVRSATVGLRNTAMIPSPSRLTMPAGVQEGIRQPGPPLPQREDATVTSVQRPRGKPTRSVNTNVTPGFLPAGGNGLGQRLPPAAHSGRPARGAGIAIPQQPIGSSSRGTWTTLTRDNGPPNSGSPGTKARPVDELHQARGCGSRCAASVVDR